MESKIQFGKQTMRECFRSASFRGKAALLLSSWFGLGLAPKAPGTVGTIGAIPLVLIISFFTIPYEILTIIAFILLSIWVSEVSRRLMGREDPQVVVIDEVAGLLLTLFLIPVSLFSVVSGFVLFRFFDILKPFPVGLIDRKVKGGFGVVLDDLMAGLYANLCLSIILFFTG